MTRELEPSELEPREREPRELRGLEKALAYVLLPPVLVWEVVRALAVDVVPSLLRSSWRVLRSSGFAAARGARSLAAFILLPIARGAASSWRWFRAALVGSIVRSVTRLARVARPIGVRVIVLLRGLAGAAILARRLSASVKALFVRVLTAARTGGKIVAHLARLFGRNLLGLVSRALAALWLFARPSALAARSAWRTVVELTRRLAVAVRAGAKVVIRSLAAPVRRAAVVVRAGTAAVARRVIAVAHVIGALVRSVWLRVTEAARRVASIVLAVGRALAAPVRRASAIVRAAAVAFARPVVSVGRAIAALSRSIWRSVVTAAGRVAVIGRALLAVVARAARWLSAGFGGVVAALRSVVRAIARGAYSIWLLASRVSSHVARAITVRLRPAMRAATMVCVAALRRAGIPFVASWRIGLAALARLRRTWRAARLRVAEVRARTAAALAAATQRARSSAVTVRAALKRAGLRASG
jgi:hypothetical protein